MRLKIDITSEITSAIWKTTTTTESTKSSASKSNDEESSDEESHEEKAKKEPNVKQHPAVRSLNASTRMSATCALYTKKLKRSPRRPATAATGNSVLYLLMKTETK